jgi:serine/threonine protein kinase
VTSKDETRVETRPEPVRKRRDTFELLGVAEDEGAYASLITWLLDPEGEHGIGSALLDQLAHFLEVLGVDWRPGEEFDGKVRVNEDNCGIVLKGAQGKGIVIVLRLSTGGGEVRGLDGVRAAGVPVMGLAYGPSAFPAASEMPVWRLQAVAQALQTIPEGPFSHLLREFRRRLGGRGRSTSHLSALETFIQSQLDSDEERTRLEGIGDEMLFNEDLSRAYVLGGLLGEGGQGAVYTVGIQGGQYFDGFANPVSKAVMKLAHEGFGANLLSEGAITGIGDPGIVRLLDQGKTAAGAPFLILERLHRLPADRLQAQPDLLLATALDIFTNLLQTLHELHFRKEGPLVLCDIKPENLLLRLPGHSELSDDEYEALVYEHSYEPVFVDVGVAQDARALADASGELPEMIGTPAYLPPESTPVFEAEEITLGTYSRKTDVYSLTLAFYALLTGQRPYAHDANLQGLVGREYLLALFELKRKPGALAYDPAAVAEVVGEEHAQAVLGVMSAGLASDPSKRPSARSLLKTCEQAFKVEPHRPRPERYLYDGPVALRMRQTLFELA